MGSRKDIPRLAFSTKSKVELQFCVFQGGASPEDFERGARRAVTSRDGGREYSPGVLWGLELVERRTRGRFEDDRVENVVVGGKREIHDCWLYTMSRAENGYQGRG